MTIKAKVRIDGHGVGIRLPWQLADIAGFKPGTVIEFALKGNTILMTPAATGQGEAGAADRVNGGQHEGNNPQPQ